MGTTLTGTTPQDTYDSLIKVTDNGPLSGTAKYLSDGLGNDSALALSTSLVGIGTNNPTWKLQVQTTDVTAAMFRSSGAGTVVGIDNSAADGDPQLKFYINDIGTFTLGVDDSDSDKFKIGTSDLTTNTRLTIDGSGNVGIGTGSPIGKLHIEGVSSGQAIRLNHSASNSFIYSTISNGNAIAFDNILGDLAIYTGGAERIRVTSNGLTFNGDTAAANALDDYEEGTWTMGVSFGGAATGVTYGTNTGKYTKIGRQITASGYVSLTSKGSVTGEARITGLPFAVPAGDESYSPASLWLITITFANQFMGYAEPNLTTVRLQELTEGGAISNLTDADFANNSAIMVSVTYFV